MAASDIQATAARPSSWPRLTIAMVVLAAVAAAVIGAERFWLATARPLGFDESWTLAVAATPDWRSFLDEAYNDVNAPLYYLLARLWAGVGGVSNLALRAPALLAIVAAGAIPIASRIKGLSFEARLTWGALVFGWWGVGVFLDARCYALLLALSTLQCVLFARLLRDTGRPNAWLWCGVAAATILLQYYALITAAAQGLIYLAARRGRAVRTWPALLAFAPAFGWMAFHAPRLAAFSARDVAWHPVISAADAAQLAAFAVNPSSAILLPVVAAVLLAATIAAHPIRAADSPPGDEARTDADLWLVVAASAAALALTLLSGALRPTLTSRYLIPVVPGVLLGLVLCTRRSAHARTTWLALMALYLGVAVRPAAILGPPATSYGYEQASEALMRRGVDQVVYVWDHEAVGVMAPSSLERVGGAFFRRAGYPATVTPLAPRPIDDINRLALAAATGPRPGIIWIYNRRGATSARAFPPRIPQVDPRWSCERFGDAMLGSLACYPAR